jgi:hypothetical protein
MTSNLNVSIGLYNSSPGTVVDIVYKEGADIDTDQPDYVLVKFDNYRGPQLNGENIFPVKPLLVLKHGTKQFRK